MGDKIDRMVNAIKHDVKRETAYLQEGYENSFRNEQKFENSITLDEFFEMEDFFSFDKLTIKNHHARKSKKVSTYK